METQLQILNWKPMVVAFASDFAAVHVGFGFLHLVLVVMMRSRRRAMEFLAGRRVCEWPL